MVFRFKFIVWSILQTTFGVEDVADSDLEAKLIKAFEIKDDMFSSLFEGPSTRPRQS